MEGYEGDGKECLAPAQVLQKQILAERKAALFSTEGAEDEEEEEEVDPCTASGENPCFGTQECSRLSNTEYDCTCPRGKSLNQQGYCVTVKVSLSSSSGSSGAGSSRYGPSSHARPMFGKGPGAQYQSHLSGPASSVGGKQSSFSWRNRNPVATPKPAWQPNQSTAPPAWRKPATVRPIATRPITTRQTTTRRPWQTTRPTPAWTPPRTTSRTTTTQRFSFEEPVYESTIPFIQTTSTTSQRAQVNFNNNLWQQQQRTSTTQPPPQTTQDADECAMRTHRCDQHALCQNQSPGYSCVCQAGFEGDGYICEDVNECARVGVCAPDSVCTNAPGSYICTCKAGYTGTSGSCVNENECLTGTHNCGESNCIDTDGSFECECPEGFSKNAAGGCDDVDECADNACHPDADCTNTPGSFLCACSSGYKGNGLLCMSKCSSSTALSFRHFIKPS